MTNFRNEQRIIALDVHPRSFGFAVFEGPDELLDFGARSFRNGMNAVRVPAQRKLGTLFDDFDPATIVLAGCGSHLSTKSSKIISALQKEALERRISVRFLTRRAVKREFHGNDRNKHEIAMLMARQFSVLASKLPPKRKCWQSEDYRMSIFDAIALGVTYFSSSKN